MFQFSTPSAEGFFLINNIVRLNIYDKFTSTAFVRPLWGLKSQFTKKEKYYTPAVDYTNKERFVQMSTRTIKNISENLPAGNIKLGTTDFPLGFYDVSIYENVVQGNLDPTGLNLVYTGIMNLICKNASTGKDAPPVEYTENNADTENNSVYLTF
tara:strand:- start:963 stop:1427 length:465 start_codon:yes stop_codon:yes gene_type:complete